MAETVAVSFDLRGDSKLLADLQALPLRIQKRVLAQALRPAAKLIQQATQANIPGKTGLAAGSLKVRAAKRSRKFPSRVTINVITSGGWFKGEAFYFAFDEWGFRAGARQESPQGFKLGYRWLKQRIPVKAKHWMKRATESQQAAAEELIKQGILAGIEREANAGAANK